MRIKVLVMCGDKVLNTHSKGHHNQWFNPWGEHIPVVGDYIFLGENTFNQDSKHKKYLVVAREFSAVESSMNTYMSQTCILQVEEKYIP